MSKYPVYVKKNSKISNLPIVEGLWINKQTNQINKVWKCDDRLFFYQFDGSFSGKHFIDDTWQPLTFNNWLDMYYQQRPQIMRPKKCPFFGNYEMDPNIQCAFECMFNQMVQFQLQALK